VALTPSDTPPQPDKRQAAQQDALLREVDDAVRQDEFAELAQKHGTKIGLVVVLGLAAFGGWLWWAERQEDALERASEDMILAIDDFAAGQADSAERTFASLAEKGDGGARIVATLARAGIATEQGRIEEATKIYAGVAADPDTPPLYRDFAIVREVLLRYDEMKPAEVEARLKPLAVPGAPWFGSAGELLGHAYLDQGKQEQAGALFRTIATDDKVPESIKFRARQMAGSMGIDAVEDVEETLDQLRNVDSQAGAGINQ
jgi:hypothetical protein